MSKIEEALEKASKLKEPYISNIQNLDVFKKVKPKHINNRHIITVTQPNSPVAEEYRRLKSLLIRATKTDFLNTIMITSAVNNEGKSLTAINLAISLAQEIDHSILLVDSDIRKPLIHEYLGIKPKLGLSDYLTQNIDISEVLIKTGISNLILLPAGKKMDNPVELLSSDKMKKLIHELKHRYVNRYIIIDSPPIMFFADAIVVGSYVDGVIFVVRERQAHRSTIENALNLIKDLNILGIVFNNVTEENLDGDYSRYYSYKHKHKKKGEE